MKEEIMIVNEMLNYCKQEVNRKNIINTMFDCFGQNDNERDTTDFFNGYLDKTFRDVNGRSINYKTISFVVDNYLDEEDE